MKDINYKYLVISSYNPKKIKMMDRKESLNYVGLYDGEHFGQPVKCKECGCEVYVMFNDYGEPELGQCMECGKMLRLYYTKSKNFFGKWYQSEFYN